MRRSEKGKRRIYNHLRFDNIVITYNTVPSRLLLHWLDHPQSEIVDRPLSLSSLVSPTGATKNLTVFAERKKTEKFGKKKNFVSEKTFGKLHFSPTKKETTYNRIPPSSSVACLCNSWIDSRCPLYYIDEVLRLPHHFKFTLPPRRTRKFEFFNKPRNGFLSRRAVSPSEEYF